MSLPYFRMYPKDYEADTSHLTLLEDGVYNRLLRLCWISPGCSLPDDEAWIIRRVRAVTDEEKAAVKLVLFEFFQTVGDRIENNRLSQEYEHSSQRHQAACKNGKKGGRPKGALKTLEKDESKGFLPENQTLTKSKTNQNQNQNQNQNHIYDGDDIRARELAFRERIVLAMGLDASGVVGPSGKIVGTRADMAIAANWIEKLGLTEDEIVSVVEDVMKTKTDPPFTFKYFERPMAELAGAKAKNVVPITPKQTAYDAQIEEQRRVREKAKEIFKEMWEAKHK